MQWLIDIVKAAIGVPPCFVNRPDPAAYDWDKTDFINDATWHKLDVSGIVPAEAKAIVLRCAIRNALVNKTLNFRRTGNVNTFSQQLVSTLVANLTISNCLIIPLSDDLKIDYLTSAGVWHSQYVVVTGWIL